MFNFEVTKEQIEITGITPYACAYVFGGGHVIDFRNDLTGLCDLLEAQGWIESWDITQEDLELVVYHNDGTYSDLAAYMADFNRREWHLLVAILENERTWKAAAREAVAALKIANPNQ